MKNLNPSRVVAGRMKNIKGSWMGYAYTVKAGIKYQRMWVLGKAIKLGRMPKNSTKNSQKIKQVLWRDMIFCHFILEEVKVQLGNKKFFKMQLELTKSRPIQMTLKIIKTIDQN